MFGLPGDLTPPSRFVRMAVTMRFADPADYERIKADDRVSLVGPEGTWVFWIDRSARILRRVERRTMESSGVVGLNVFDPYGFLLFPEGGEPAMEAAPGGAGSGIIEQAVGTAPSLRWLWTMG